MPFVDNHVRPLHFRENRLLTNNVFVCRDEDLESAHANARLEVFPDLRRAVVDESIHTRSPFLELVGPVGESGKRDNDKVGAGIAFNFDEEANEGNSLDGLAETLDEYRKR